jgi:hypothetical protein
MRCPRGGETEPGARKREDEAGQKIRMITKLKSKRVKGLAR